jgi:hypothetical protein
MPLSLLRFTTQGNRTSWSHFAFYADHGRDICVPQYLETITAVPQYNHNRLLATTVVKTTLPFLVVTAGDKALLKRPTNNTATLSDMTIGQTPNKVTETMFRTSLNRKLPTFQTVPSDSRIWGRGENTCLPHYVRHTNNVDTSTQRYCLLCTDSIASAPPYRLDERPTARAGSLHTKTGSQKKLRGRPYTCARPIFKNGL